MQSQEKDNTAKRPSTELATMQTYNTWQHTNLHTIYIYIFTDKLIEAYINVEAYINIACKYTQL